jgi:hypothetical protein
LPTIFEGKEHPKRNLWKEPHCLLRNLASAKDLGPCMTQQPAVKQSQKYWGLILIIITKLPTYYSMVHFKLIQNQTPTTTTITTTTTIHYQIIPYHHHHHQFL